MHIRYTDRADEERTASLAETFANLARDDVRSFPALRAHQRQPWHCFLVQVATMALFAAARDTLPTDADDWNALLLGLTPDHPDGEPWQLVVDHWSKPALLQPPGMPVAARGGKKQASTPDGIDMLLTGRNHDLKGARMARARDDDWLFALVTLQTSEGQMGAGNFGISRMNGGYGARVFAGIRLPSATPGRAFVRDVEVLLTDDALREAHASSDRTGLLWLLPWDGKKQLSFGALAPLYVEVCRRVRLCDDGSGSLRAVLESSAVSRVDAKVLKGVTGDPWAPVLADATASWGIGASGFGYRQMTRLLSPTEITLPPLAEVRSVDGTEGIVLYVCGLTRGQGKTEGFHERELPFPPAAARRFGRPEGRDRIADIAQARTHDAGTAQRIVRHALMSLYQGGPETPRLDDDASATRMETPLRAFDDLIDAAFFDDAFWEQASAERLDDATSERYARAWRERLRDFGRETMTLATRSMPRSRMKQWRAVARSRSLFERRMRRFVDPDADSPAESAALRPEPIETTP